MGFLFAGVQALLSQFAPSLVPTWADYDALATFIPTLADAFSPFMGLIFSTTLLLVIFLAVNYYTKFWTTRKIPFAFLLILWGLISTNISASGEISFWLLKGIISGLLLLLFYWLIIRHQMTLLPFFTGAMIILGPIKHIIQNPHPAAIAGGAISLIIVITLALFWQWKMASQSE